VQAVEHHEVPDPRLAAQQEHRRDPLDERAGEIGREHDRAPRQPVGPHATDQHEDRLRQDPGDQDDAEIGRGAAQVEHRERQRDREDAVAQHRDRLGPEEEREIALAQNRQAPPAAHGKRA
jgi:hypothetical protein